MAKQNQGFRKDLNLEETTDEAVAINNLAGAGIADDLAIIQNNLVPKFIDINLQSFS